MHAHVRTKLVAVLAAVTASTMAVGACHVEQPTERLTPAESTLLPPAGSTYVALGSSFAAGPSIPPLVDPECMRSGNDYPSMLARMGGLKLVDKTCSGATTTTILRQSQHVGSGQFVPPQIDAVTANTKLVTVTVGGNDINFVGKLISGSCATVYRQTVATTAKDNPTNEFGAQREDLLSGKTISPSCPAILSNYTMKYPNQGAFNYLVTNLTDIVKAVRLRAPKALVLLVDYLPVTTRSAPKCAALPLTPAQIDMTSQMTKLLYRATAEAGQQTGAMVIRPQIEANEHTVCSRDPWVNGFATHNDSGERVSTPAPYHPNYRGMAAVANLIRTTLDPAAAR